MTRRRLQHRPGTHPIVPIMLGDAALAAAMAERLLERGVYVVGFSYPVVPQGKARDPHAGLGRPHTRRLGVRGRGVHGGEGRDGDLIYVRGDRVRFARHSARSSPGCHGLPTGCPCLFDLFVVRASARIFAFQEAKYGLKPALRTKTHSHEQAVASPSHPIGSKSDSLTRSMSERTLCLKKTWAGDESPAHAAFRSHAIHHCPGAGAAAGVFAGGAAGVSAGAAGAGAAGLGAAGASGVPGAAGAAAGPVAGAVGAPGAAAPFWCGRSRIKVLICSTGRFSAPSPRRRRS